LRGFVGVVPKADHARAKTARVESNALNTKLHCRTAERPVAGGCGPAIDY
jgi:hypothetical protein